MKGEKFSIFGLGIFVGVFLALGLSSLPGGIKHFQLQHAKLQDECEKYLPRNQGCIATYVPAKATQP